MIGKGLPTRHSETIGEVALPTRRQMMVHGAAASIALTAFSVTGPGLFERAWAAPSDDKRAEAQQALSKLDELQHDLDIAAADYAEAQMVLDEANAALEEALARIAETEQRIAVIQKRLGTRARSMYRTGSVSFLDMLLGASTFREFVNNWEILSDLNDDDAKLVSEAKALKEQLVAEREECEHQQELAAAAEASALQAAQDAQLLVDEMESTYARLNSEAQELLAQEEAERERQLREEALERIENNDTSLPSAPPRPNTNINNLKEQTIDAALVLARAEGEMGKSYVWGACGPDAFDCSGLVSYCLCGEYGKRLGTTYTFYYWTRVTDPQPGDICVSWGHCGIYIGDGQMIHAPNRRKKVQVGSVQPDMIYVRY